VNVLHINDVNDQLIGQYQSNESIASIADKQTISAKEKGDCSNVSTEILKPKIEVQKVPGVRDEKVLEIKGQIERGIYSISGEQIACKMMKESIIHLFGLDLGLKNYVVRHFLYEPGPNAADDPPIRDGITPICFNRTLSVLITNKK